MVSISKAFRFICYSGLAVLAINYWLSSKTYLVNPQDVERLAKSHKGDYQLRVMYLPPKAIFMKFCAMHIMLLFLGTNDVQKAFADIEKGLRKKYKGHIIPKKDTQWIFVNSGGWMGSMYILHASLTEYILFFGTAVDTTGHSGRYWANITDTVLTGTFRQWTEGELQSQVFQSGDTIFHRQGQATAVQWAAGTWMVEYGRGFIPSTLPFALADTVFGTTDFFTFYYTVRIYCKALMNETAFVLVDAMAWAGISFN